VYVFGVKNEFRKNNLQQENSVTDYLECECEVVAHKAMIA
jgi:hypothetical protein